MYKSPRDLRKTEINAGRVAGYRYIRNNSWHSISRRTSVLSGLVKCPIIIAVFDSAPTI